MQDIILLDNENKIFHCKYKNSKKICGFLHISKKIEALILTKEICLTFIFMLL